MMQSRDKFASAVPALLASLILISLACGGSDAQEPDDLPTGVAVVENTPGGSNTPRPRRSTSATPTTSPTPLQVCAPNPDPAPANALQVQAPSANERLQFPVHVRGWGANIGQDDRGVFVAIVNEKQQVLQVNKVPPQPREFRVAPIGLEITDFTRPFAIDLVLPDIEQETPYCIWVYQDTDERGSARGVVQVPIVVQPR